MLYREIVAVCSQIHTKHINALCGLNVEFVNLKSSYGKVFIRTQKVNVKSNALKIMSLPYSRLID